MSGPNMPTGIIDIQDALKTRAEATKALCEDTATDTNANGCKYWNPEIEHYYGVWLNEFSYLPAARPDLITAVEIQGILDWFLSYSLTSPQNYTGPYSSASLTAPVGTLPFYITKTGLTSFIMNYINSGVGDRPLYYPLFIINELAWQFGRATDWSGAYFTWFAANKDKLQAAYDSAQFDGTTGLVKQDDTYPGCQGTVTDNWCLTGGLIESSIQAYQAAVSMTDILTRGGYTSEIANWQAKIDSLQAGIQGAFYTEQSGVTLLYEYYHETFHSYPYATNSAVLEGWSVAKTETSPFSIVVDPTDSSKKCLKISCASGNYANIYKRWASGTTLLAREQYLVQYDCLRVKAMVAQTNVGCSIIIPSNDSEAAFFYIVFGNDGHFKYWNGSALVNFSTDITYSVNAWYWVETRINYTSNTYSVYIGTSLSSLTTAQTGITPLTTFVGKAMGRMPNGGVNFTGSEAYAATMYLGEIIGGCVPASPITGDKGWLPYSTGNITLSGPSGYGTGGRKPNPFATAYAVWCGVLTSAQNTAASKWLNHMFVTPKKTSQGADPLFCFTSGYGVYCRNNPWAYDDRHGMRTFGFGFNSGEGITYGYFENGGYFMFWPQHMVYALNLTDPTAAAKFMTYITSGLLNTNAPYEDIAYILASKTMTSSGSNYLSSTFGIAACALIVTPDYPAVGDVRDGIPFNNANEYGTLELPAEADVKNGVHYGAVGTEFTGSYSISGSGGGRSQIGGKSEVFGG